MVQTAIIIPAHNEAKSLGLTLQAIVKLKIKDSLVIVVDDGSSDNTGNIALANNALLLRHKVNLGKGAALKTGCEYALMQKFQTLVLMDADTQHSPDEIPKFLQALKSVPVVIGIRSFSGEMPLVLKFGNWIITHSLYLLYNIRLDDVLCGYRAMTKEAYQRIRWSSADYAVEVEMIARIGRCSLPYKTIKIKTVYADKYKGTTIFDGVKIVWSMFMFKFAKSGE